MIKTKKQTSSPEKTKDRKIRKRLFKVFVRWLPLIVIGLIFGIARQAADILRNDVLGRAFDFVLSNVGIDTYDALWIILVLAVLSALSSVITTYCMGKTTHFGMFDFTMITIKHIKRLPMAFLDRHSTGDFVSRINNDLKGVRDFIGNEFINILISVIASISIMVYFVIKNWILGSTVIVVVAIIMPIIEKSMKKLERLQVENLEKKGDTTSIASDVLQGIRETKAFNAREKVVSEFNKIAHEEQVASIKASTKAMMGKLYSGLASQIPTVIVLGVGGWLVFAQKTTIGVVFALNTSLLILRENLYTTTYGITMWKKVLAGAIRVFELWDKDSEYDIWERQRDNTISSDAENDYVYSFKNVSFAYPLEKEDLYKEEKTIAENIDKMVLKNIDIDINKGETIAFVGRSGCGKTTLLKLIAGFYNVNEGVIFKKGVDIADMKLDDVRADLTMVSQNSFLFSETIHNNISYGKGVGIFESNDENKITPEIDIINASKAANIHAFVQKQPHKYQSLVGERGIKLSGGQRQRVSIARAIYKDADILLLDEPTSALDTESEYIVQDALAELMKEKTSIIVAHRLSGIKGADRIYVMDEGEIVEQGTHDKLISDKGLYYELYQRQLSDKDSELKVNG